jgi:hypothetical protein
MNYPLMYPDYRFSIVIYIVLEKREEKLTGRSPQPKMCGVGSNAT